MTSAILPDILVQSRWWTVFSSPTSRCIIYRCSSAIFFCSQYPSIDVLFAQSLSNNMYQRGGENKTSHAMQKQSLIIGAASPGCDGALSSPPITHWVKEKWSLTQASLVMTLYKGNPRRAAFFRFHHLVHFFSPHSVSRALSIAPFDVCGFW